MKMCSSQSIDPLEKWDNAPPFGKREVGRDLIELIFKE
jgi:hypothetical protein